MTDPVTHQQLGEHAAYIEVLRADVAEIKGDVKLLVARMNETRGGWRTLATIGTAGGVAGGLLVKLAAILAGAPPPHP